MFSHKKGITFLVGLITVLISFVLVFTLIRSSGDRLDEELEGENCRFTIGLEDAVEKVPFLSYENTCVTLKATIPTRPRRLVQDKLAVSEDIANKIVRAWDITHNGNIKDLWEKEGFTAFSKSQCLVMFDLNIKYLPVEDYLQRDLYDFIKVTDYQRIDGKMEKYLGYILRSGDSGAFIMPESFEVIELGDRKTIQYTPNEIEVGKNYAISIISPMHSTIQREYDTFIGSTGNDRTSWDQAVIDFFDSLGSTADAENILMFSSLDYAFTRGCRYVEGSDTT